MANKSKVFPLDFDAQEWTLEAALPWVFFGDFRDKESWTDLTDFAIKFMVGDVDERSNSIHLKPYTRELQKHFREHGVMRRHTAFSPLVWCRLAIQFWLKLGGRQEAFMSAMTKWVRKQNKGGMAFVVYRCASTGKKRRMPMEAFLFGRELPDLMSTEWEYKQKAVSSPKLNGKSLCKGARIDEDKVGANLLGALRSAVADLAKGTRNKSSLLRRLDPETGKYRYRGGREDLLGEVCLQEDGAKGKWRFKNGGGGPYATSALLKAVSMVAICRKSWP
ncbi:hypothetical protein DFR40_0146 [Azonexus fungiphilus]|uniref:Uncharacterized protein n=1 Tax=Azonexus fungiphilus TaxID=146940 RepID=A0A495WNN7_9RHOO|nr:hypothetical protein [Azonexus fungiphilus]RKT63096.1 hypothetical protein DFR40_0146 [Azonexus fungiphilus]